MSIPTPREHGTALVTGASAGIGTEIARDLARRGFGVTLVARRTDRLEVLAKELSEAHSIRAEVVGVDLSDNDARASLPATMSALDLEVDIVVNNAGFGTYGTVVKADRDRELLLVDTNVSAVVDLCTQFVPAMSERASGAILNVASTAAFQPLPGQAAYGASKAFVLSYTEALAAELKPRGVHATALCPGPVATEFEEVAGIDHDDATMLPGFMWLDASAVARAGVDGLLKGKGLVIPGLANTVGARFGHYTPRTLLMPLLRRHPALKDG